LAQKVSTDKGHFLFRAGDEGEYWFSIRTIGRSAQVRPAPTETPGLRVVVDHTGPVLEVHAEEDQSGAINVQWHITEQYPDLATFKIQYRSDASAVWQNVLIDHESASGAGPVRSGRASWSPRVPHGSTHVEIRAELADTAGNRGVAHARVALRHASMYTAHASGDGTSAEVEDRVGAASSGQAATGWRSSSTRQQVASALQESLPPPIKPLEANPYASPAGVAGSRPEASDEESILGIAPKMAVRGQIHPPVRSQYISSNDVTEAPSPFGRPKDQHLQMVNTSEFELEYEVATAADVRQVELWVTRDGGQSWQRHGVDEDGQSPMLTSVNEEGVYGFRVVPTRGQAIPNSAPRRGQTPDLWIAVDLKSPLARIVSVEEREGDEAGKLLIRWEADDCHLAARPVSLFFQETRGGPWSVIAAGLANTGQYVWPVARRVSEAVYVRLEVRDQAGNLGVDETEQPILLGRARPPAQILDVRPVHQDMTDSQAW
jgi:hypothetical protein